MIKKTTIGSFPIKPTASYEESIIDAINLQLGVECNPVSGGEPRGKMWDYLFQYSGIEPAYMAGIKFVKRIWNRNGIIKNLDPDESWKIKEYRLARSYLDDKGMKDVKIKIAITGPITLIYFGKFGAMYEGLGPYKKLPYKELYSDSVELVGSVAKRAVEVGADLQIDEPGIIHASPEDIDEILGSVLKKLPSDAKEKVSVHACTELGKSHYNALMRQKNFSVLNIPFGESQIGNFDVISRESLEENEKTLGVGFIPNKYLEPVGTSLERLKKVSEKVGRKKISFVNPFCGFSETNPEFVGPILANMDEALRIFNESILTQQ
jgi:methionine synthase II (cobalamin-independent)